MSLVIVIIGQASPDMEHWGYYFNDLDFVHVAGQYDTLDEAMPLLYSTMIHALVLGKQIPELGESPGDGTMAGDDPVNILTLSYPEKRNHAFEIYAVDILNMPLTQTMISAVMEKIYYKVLTEGVETAVEKQSYNNYFFVRYENQSHLIRLEDLLYIEIFGHTCILHQWEGRVVTSDTPEQIQAYLPPWQFQQVHKHFIVNLAFVEQLTENIVTVGPVTIPVKSPWLPELKRQYKLYRKLKDDEQTDPLQN